MLVIYKKKDQTSCMKELILTSEEKIILESRHRNSHDSRECDRIKAVLLRSEGWTIARIAQALRHYESTINRHISDYYSGKLMPKNGGSKSYLNKHQTSELIQHLEKKTYHCNHEIISYVESTYSIKYSVPGMNKWLHANNFSYKKPKGFPHKADKDKQASFVEEYKALKDSVGPEEPILFMDTVHPSQATKLSYGWIRTGQDKSVKTTASRTRMNIVGAIELCKLSKAITHDYQTVNQTSVEDFLSQVRAGYKEYGTIHMILDGAGYHRAESVAKKAKELRIELHFLPPYSPNLNPIERLWKVMNEKVRNNQFFSNAKEFRESIRHFFKKILPDIADELNDRINDNFQQLNYAP